MLEGELSERTSARNKPSFSFKLRVVGLSIIRFVTLLFYFILLIDRARKRKLPITFSCVIVFVSEDSVGFLGSVRVKGRASAQI